MDWIIQFEVFALMLSEIVGELKECYGVRCLNGGSSTIETGLCRCSCTEEFTGIICETKTEPSLWPTGPYSLPMSKYGCPEPRSHGWQMGYISIVTMDTVHARGSKNSQETNGTMDSGKTTKTAGQSNRTWFTVVRGPIWENGFVIHFCTKSRIHKTNTREWLSTVTTVYQKDGVCPQGFTSGQNISLDIPNIITLNTDGVLPDMVINRSNNFTVITMLTCVQFNSSREVKNVDHYNNILVPLLTEECPTVKGLDIKHEVVVLDIENNQMDGDTSDKNSSEVQMAYCFYKLNMSKDFGLQLLNETVEDIDNFYQVPFQTRNHTNNPSVFSRSKLLYGVELHSIYPVMEGPRVIVRDMYGIHSYTGESGLDPYYRYRITTIPTQPFFNIPYISTMDATPWIMVQLQGIQTVTSVFVALRIDKDENPESLANNPNFQNPEISVSKFDTDLKNHGAYIVDFTTNSFYKSGIKANDYYPHVYNLDLPTPHVLVEHRFKISMSCQYLTISFPSYQLTDDDQRILLSEYFNRMVGINFMGSSIDEINFCGKSRILHDYQLTASSSQGTYQVNNSRLYNSGWCAEITDPLPYIQVDMIFPVIIGGIKVVNWQSIEDLQVLDLGVRSFSLMYGFDTGNLVPYGRKNFEIDLSDLFGHVHTFLFEDRIMARFIRIYPQALDSVPCLRFELIQCYTDDSADLSMDCSEDSTVVNTTTSFASFKQPVETQNITSWSECRDLCFEAVQECNAFEFHENNQSCLVYEYNRTSSVRTILQDDTSSSTLSTKFCLKDTGTSRVQRKYHVVHDEGTLTSDGFPFSYRTGEVTTWFVVVDDGMFVQVLFTNISLNVYQNNTTCSDRITISLLEYGRFQAEREVEYINPIKKEITASSNGEYITYWGETSSIYITFETCESRESPMHVGKGFRALIRQTDAPFCSGGWNIEYRFQMPCSQLMMYIGSETYLDSTPLRLTDEYMVFYLHLFGGAQGDVRYVELMITDLNIPCKSENIQFIIDDIGSAKQTSYCTHNRPPYIIRSTLWGLTIKMTYSSYIYTKDYEDNRWHGFFGYYRFITNNETVYNWMTSKEEEYTPWEYEDYGIYARKQWTVCSDKLGSCYTFFPTLYTNGSWTKSQEMCMSYGQNLVAINTEDEYHFVRLLAENYTRYTRYVYDSHYTHLRLNPGDRESHIGLVRFQDGATMMDMWLDGTPLVFNSWAEGQPSNPLTKHCTKMHLLTYSAESTWYSEDCYSDDSRVGNFICERQMEKQKSHSNISVHLQYSPYNTMINSIKGGLFRCSSGEYLSWISVCNGFPECADNSDEIGCSQDGCSDVEFECYNGRCISYNLVCDDYIDCPQGEDELCSSDQEESDIYRCGNDQIIPGFLACNGKLDCFDGTDERWCVTCKSSTQCLGLDRTCLPYSLKCDGYTDCSDGKDEQSCSKFPIEFCDDWWGLGNKDNGVYEIGGAQLKCNFDNVSEWETITIIPLDLVYSIADTSIDYFTNTLLTYEVNQYIYDRTFGTCYVTVYETLLPAIKRVLDEEGLSYEMDQVFGSTKFSTYTNNQLFSTSDQDIQRILGRPDGSDVSPRKRLLYTDVICKSDFYDRIYNVPCAGGYQSVRPSGFCKWGVCRSMSHLWNCEDYVCPTNYIKCPGSFCITADLLCDGRVHCPGGEDELNCYCKDNRRDVYIIASNRKSSDDFEALYHFSQQLVSLTNIVTLNLVTLPDLPTFTEFDIKSERVQMLDSRLRHRTAVIQKDHKLNTTELMNFIISDRRGKGMLDNKTIVEDDYADLDVIVLDDLTNSDLIWDKVFPSTQSIPDSIKPYRVLLDDSIQRSADVDDQQGFTEIKLQKVEFLQNGGVFLFQNICKAYSKESCENGFKCQASPKCLPLDLVCDGYINCPVGDDERICFVTCPEKCTCQGHILDCNNRNFTSQDFWEIPRESRILDLSNNPSLTKETFRIYKDLFKLIKLDLSDSGLKSIDKESFKNLPTLQSLDLRNNLITVIPTFTFWHLDSLVEIQLSGNKLINFIADQAFTGLDNIRTLSLTGTNMVELTTQPFIGLNLDSLDISGNLKLRTISDGTFTEDYVCPTNYIKCPGSFCITADLLCDGRVHCPGGEDELNCYCKDNRRDVYIIASNRKSSDDFEALYHFSQQLVSLTNIVTLNLVTLPDLPTFTEFDIKSERVQMLDSRLRHRTAVIQKDHKLNTTELMNFIISDRRGKGMLDNKTIVEDDYADLDVIVLDDLTNSDLIWDKVFPSTQSIPDSIKPYRVLLDDSIQRSADVDDQQGFTEIKLQKVEFLQNGGVFLFQNICKAYSKESCENGFKCQASPKCLPLDLVCDGYINCPVGDDERICFVTCPEKCTCQGHILDCNNRNFTSQDFWEIPRESRILDLSNNPSLTKETFRIYKDLFKLIKLDLSDSGLKSIDKESFKNLPTLQSLDLRNNLITVIPTFTFWHLDSLVEIQLSGNKLINFIADQAFTGLDNIRTLSLTGTNMVELTTQPFIGLNLDSLDISGNLKLRTISDGTFTGLTVKKIDFENCPINSFTADMFTGISDLEEMATSAFKFCCIRPQTVLQSKCTPYQDEFSSCEDLMRDVSQRALLWIIGLLALIGNSLVLVYRLIINRSHLKLGHGIFVTNLALSDFFMGLYLIIIALADQVFRNRYIWMEDYWRNSGWCTFAGILSTISSESSILFISLITLDRIFVIKFPFGQVRFRTTTALATTAGCWILVILLSTIPLMFTSHFQNEFYSKSGVCIALPLTRERYPGWLYSIVIFVGFNFVTFVLIALGQILIFQEVRRSSQKFKKGKSTRANDLKVARNLLLVVSTDFLCWGPVGIMGLMSVGGSIIPPTVYAWTAVLILPINSALNPFLYTVSAFVNRNAFKPRLDEQTKLDPSELLLLKNMLYLWRAQFVNRKTNEEKNDRAIAAISRLPAVEIGKMALRLAICLRFLHKLHFKMDGINFLAIEKDGENEDIPFVLDPSLQASDKEMAEDMLKYGQLLQSMLEKF